MERKAPMTHAWAAAAAFVLGAAATPGVQAQSQPSPDAWQFSAALYGWFPALSGDTQFPSGKGGPSIDLSSGDVLDHLKMTFMGTLQARKGQWGGLVDWVYADLGATKTGTRDFTIGGQQVPSTAGANLSLDAKTNILTLAGTYAAVMAPEHSLDVVFGTRMLDMSQTLNWAVTGNLGSIALPGRSGTSKVDGTNWDAILGVKGRLRFGDGLSWFVPYYLDVGTGESQFTWQIQAGLGYSFRWGDLVATWRYLDYDMKSDKALQSLTMNGPAIGAVFRW